MTEFFPVLPLRDVVVFPHMIVPLFIGREKSARALEHIMKGDKQIALVTQRNASEEYPDLKGLYETGVLANILQILKLSDGTVKALVEGIERVHIEGFVDRGDFCEVGIERIQDIPGDEKVLQILVQNVMGCFENYIKIQKNIPEDVQSTILETTDGSTLADLIARNLNVDVARKQEILELRSVSERLEQVFVLMNEEMNTLKIERKIKTRVKSQMERTQREYYLNEQMKAIQKELGNGDDGQTEISELEEKIRDIKLSKEAHDKALSEIKKLKSMPPMSSEATVVRNYLDWLFCVPWKKKSRIKKNLAHVQEVLDGDHYGLEKIKERIIEFLAVHQRSKKLKGPILCLVGPPGVGKTSLGKSIARATGQEFIRISLGGVRDESEIRGHRRTYIGSMPGKIIQSLKRVKTTNPLILLDEVDKLGNDFRGDPASALLEVLDPEQNSTFVDHYLEVEYDLSNVTFITTANSYNMAPALLDRMEIIRLPGYTEEEKIEIARQHLIKRQIENHGLKAKELSISDDAVTNILRYYTREAGVRNLERELATLARKTLTKIVRKEEKTIVISEDNLADFLGVRKFKYGLVEEQDQIGRVSGLAYTESGGDLLSIEALLLPGHGRMKTTGKLGDVMKESIEAAVSFVRSISPKIGVPPSRLDKYDIHVHVPEGATPKDGPSAGIAMVCSIVSVLSNIPIRKDIAMTGEVTLRGHVLQIGGLKEKLLAALRGRVSTVLIPEDNRKDLVDLPESVLKGIKIIPVSHVDKVLEYSLLRAPEPLGAEEVRADENARLMSHNNQHGYGEDGSVRAH